MFAGIKNGAELTKGTIRAFGKHPQLIFPLLGCWLIYAPSIVYSKFFFPWGECTLPQQFLFAFFHIFLFSFVLSFSCLILLEIIRQIETTEDLDLWAATAVATKTIFKALPVVFLWAILWFLISLIEAILSRKGSDDDDDLEFTPENVATELGGGFEGFSISRAFFEALRKGVRMIVFLIYPALSWEKASAGKAIKKGLGIAKLHKVEFATGFLLTELAGIIVFLPPFLLFLWARFTEFPDWVWFVAILYIGLAWSFSMLLEQLFAAELYLWHLLWKKDCAEALTKGLDEPKFSDTNRPSILNDIPELRNVIKE
jgi:hypothetical protein